MGANGIGPVRDVDVILGDAPNFDPAERQPLFLIGCAPRAAPVEAEPEAQFGPLVGSNPRMRELYARLFRVAGTDATVLVQGETGTGKELVARAIHDASARAGGPFVVVDCGALPDNLIEAELFGRARGAFTGAVDARPGAIEAADGGTVFLDEVGELTLAMQPKLLRVLESRSVRRLGEANHRPVNVRFVSATHRNLAAMIGGGRFREDLYYRLAVLPVTIPPLRERPDDIAALVQHFLPPQHRGAIAAETLRDLASQPWPGNVRELRNFVERAVALGPGEALALAESTPPVTGGLAVTLPEALLALPYKQVRERALDQIERDYIEHLLARHGRNVTAAAHAAGLNRGYVHRLIRKHGL